MNQISFQTSNYLCKWINWSDTNQLKIRLKIGNFRNWREAKEWIKIKKKTEANELCNSYIYRKSSSSSSSKREKKIQKAIWIHQISMILFRCVYLNGRCFLSYFIPTGIWLLSFDRSYFLSSSSLRERSVCNLDQDMVK